MNSNLLLPKECIPVIDGRLYFCPSRAKPIIKDAKNFSKIKVLNFDS